MDVAAFRRAVSRWHRVHGRNLPWRDERDPYRVWLREIMLQQTTVTAVIPYLDRFLSRFPTLADLATAEEADVLRQWEGLGYYSRARNLHKAAKILIEDHKGEWPREAEALEQLPGIGRYTAGAIASFAFDRPAAIVEANTERLYCRLMGYEDDPRSTAGRKALWGFAQSLVPRTRPGQFNQALMDLGATVCTPQQPSCETCPVSAWCEAARLGLQTELPRLTKRPEITEVVEAAVAVRGTNGWLLRRRAVGERWAGLWDFPRFSLDDSAATAALPIRELAEGVWQQTGIRIDPQEQFAEFRHSVTRYRITLRCFLAEPIEAAELARDDLAWVPTARFQQFPLSKTGRELANRLHHSLFA